MGQKCCKAVQLSKEDLDDYVLLTYLSRSEILSVFRKFQKLDPITVEENRGARLTIEQVLVGVDELRLNPFGDRVCTAFSSDKDGKMGFDDFLDMYSVMSDAATLEAKTHFAFAVYDFDSDGVIGRDDLTRTVDR
jgi:calcium and integrin-binding protein 1